MGEYRDTGSYTNSAGDSSGAFYIKIAYDYDDTWVDQFTFNLNEDNFTEGDRFRLRVRPSQGKCSAIKIGLFEIASTSAEATRDAGEGVWISALSLEVEAKESTTKEQDITTAQAT